MSGDISILILAAGASTRMGDTIKQLLPWRDSTLIEHAVQTAQQVSDAVVVVLGANRKEIEKTTQINAETVYNPDWEQGMGSSISTGVRHILSQSNTPRAVLIMLADQPMIDAPYLNQLKKEMDTGNFKIVGTSYGNRAGVPAIFHASLLGELAKLNEEYGAKSLIQCYKDAVSIVKPEGKEADIDTLSDYQQLFKNQ